MRRRNTVLQLMLKEKKITQAEFEKARSAKLPRKPFRSKSGLSSIPYYVDRVITPIIAVTEDSLREAYRSVLHPFRKEKFDEARPKLKQWLVVERMRVAELEFLQGARARIRISPARNVPR